MENKNTKLIVAGLVVLVITFFVYQNKMLENNHAAMTPTGQLGAEVVPTAYKLDLTVDPTQDRFSGRVAIDIKVNNKQSFLWLHGINLNVTSVTFTNTAGEAMTGTYLQVDDTGVSKVSFEKNMSVGDGTLVMDYDALFNPSLEGIYKVMEGGESYAFTQYEATSARFAFPSFDEPRFKTVFDVSVTYPTGQTVITNTPLVSEDDLGNGMTKAVFAPTKPLPTYLLALAVGPLDVVSWEDIPATELRSNPIPLRAISAKGKGERLKYALKNTALMVTTLEEYFGVKYPYAKLDLIAVPDFNAGAMENAGAITYREQRLLLDDNSSIGIKRSFISTHTHELAHMWFGDLVTPKWWDDIWLNESFATWMANKALNIAHPDGNYGGNTINSTHFIMGADSRVNVRQVRQPILSHHDIATAFDLITYLKGGAILEMFENYMGEDAFREGIRLHMRRFAFGTANVYDFMSSLEDGSGQQGIAHSFTSFIEQPGIPFLTISDYQTGANGTSFKVSQSRYLPLGSRGSRDAKWPVPMCISFGVEGGKEKRCVMLNGKQEMVDFADVKNATYMHPNDNGTGYYRWSVDEAVYEAILANFGTLTASEKKSLYDAASSSYAAGGTSVAQLVAVSDTVSQDSTWDVANRSIQTMTGFIGLAESEKAKEAVLSHVRGLYAPALSQLGLWPYTAADEKDPSGTALKRSAIVNFLATTGKMPSVRSDLLAMAKGYIGFEGNGELNPKVINSDFIGSALTIGVEDVGESFSEALLAHFFKSTDAVLRQNILNALVSTKDASIDAKLLEMVSSEDVRDNEANVIYFGLAGENDKHDMVWNWMLLNQEKIVDRLPTWAKGNLANTVQGWCDASEITDIKAFFDPIIEGLEGGPRVLDQNMESIELCTSLKEVRQPEVEAYFSAM